MATDGTPRITWHGRDFAATIEIIKFGEIETSVEVPAVDDPWLRRFIAAVVACERIEGANHIAPVHLLVLRLKQMIHHYPDRHRNLLRLGFDRLNHLIGSEH